MKIVTPKFLAILSFPLTACALATEGRLQSDPASTLAQFDGRCTDPSSLGAELPCPESLGRPMMHIEPLLLDNMDLFKGDFYQRFDLRHADKPLSLPGDITKDYFFPTLYGDVTSSIALFFCSYEQAKALMPSPALKPVNMGLGRSVVVLSSYRYNKVLGIGPYNEIAISIPVVAENVNVPILPLLLEDFRGLGFYVVSMPVTTLENRIRGQEIWGLPKVVQEINLRVDGDEYVTTALDDNGETYLEFRVPMKGTSFEVDQKNHLYSQLRGAIVRSPAHSKGKFVQTRWPKAFILKNLAPQRSFLTLGSSAAADMLRRLEIEPQPFQVRFSPAVESTFDLPGSVVAADQK